jgi:hypothetical protein
MHITSGSALRFMVVGLSVVGCASSNGDGGSGGNMGTAGVTGGGMGGAAGGTVTTCTPAPLDVGGGTLASPFGSAAVTAGGRNYYLQVNEWNTAANMARQTMAVGGGTVFKMTAQAASVPTTGGPAGYPSIFIGSNSGHTTPDVNLPKLVSSLTTVPTTWSWSDAGTLADTAANSYNATYDVWFSTTAAGDPASPSGGFLMVWYYDPPDAQPLGSRLYSAVTIPNVSGTWDVWIGLNNGKVVVSYLRTQRILSLSYDLNEFIKDAVNNRRMNGNPTIQSTWYLSNIFAGFEIWRGGLNLETTGFCAVVN